MLSCPWFQKERFASFLFNFVKVSKKFWIPTTLLKKQVFSCEYCEIFRDRFYVDHLYMANASVTFKWRITGLCSAEIQYTYVKVWYLREMYVPMYQHWVVCFAFHAPFPGCLIQHFILMTSFKILELRISNDQKQPSEVFCKKKCSEKFRKFHRRTSAFESFFQ